MNDAPSNKQAEDSQPPAAPCVREAIRRSCEVPPNAHGLRFDQVAAQLFPEFSRGRLQQWIRSGDLTLDGAPGKTRQKLVAGSILQLDAEFESETVWQAEALPLNIVFEDDELLVIDKPAGCTVHPAPGLNSGTLANAVLAHSPGNAELPRCGIVHRLDKDTTGLLVVAKSLRAHASLVEQLQQRSVSRIYRAVACGQIIAGGTIDAPIGRHATARTRMAVVRGSAANKAAKPAVTHYRIEQRFRQHTELRIKLETGRTHQIRVHMAHTRHPLVGDPVYNARYRRPAGINDALDAVLKRFNRQALHATELEFLHPATGEHCSFASALPDDYAALLAALGDASNYAAQ
ncbi:MAG: 23S rRNA pseudouridine(1911/1915/1917) synthase RluD [Pseudomonadales bacterium]|nr:23S rRNA pseudouridine(1911/1915/1917) synthase RluD [Pseudomonadales bacterium]